jgi:hypothetical protein
MLCVIMSLYNRSSALLVLRPRESRVYSHGSRIDAVLWYARQSVNCLTRAVKGGAKSKDLCSFHPVTQGQPFVTRPSIILVYMSLQTLP